MINHIPARSGASFKLKKDQRLLVYNPEGKQVSDMILINEHDINEKLSSGKTFDYEESILITKGNYIWSNRSNRMAYIVEDTCGRNDFLLAPCDSETFAHFYDSHDPSPSCLGNLSHELQKYGIHKDAIPTAFNLFMHVDIAAQGSLRVLPPKAKAGDYIEFKAEMDLIVALTACSAKDSNGGSFKSITYEVLR